MSEAEDDPYEATTRWLQEAARRPKPDRREPSPSALPPAAKPRRVRTILGVGRELYLFAVLAATYLNYYFMQVTTEIDSLPSIVLFIAPIGPLS